MIVNCKCKTAGFINASSKQQLSDFPGGAVDKNLPANAEGTSSIPGPGRFHMPWNN